MPRAQLTLKCQHSIEMPPRVLSAALCVCATAAFVPPWTYDGFDRFPALWFGANASGLDNSSQLALVARHSLAGYGWQQGVNRTDYRHGETSLAQAAVHLADFVAENGQTNATPTKTFVYRHFQMSWAVFDITRAANANAANAAMFLRSNDNTGVQCGQPDAAHNTSSPLLVYLPLNESGATDFWVNEVVAEVALESGVDACFFDETVRNARPPTISAFRPSNCSLSTGLELLRLCPRVAGKLPEHFFGFPRG